MNKLTLSSPCYYDFHPDASVNFQLNRMQNNSGCSVKETMELAGTIDGYSSVTPNAMKMYERAKKEGRNIDALFYLRLAEFFCFETEKKNNLYNLFRKSFYSIFAKDNINTYEVPYEGGALPVMECLPEGKIIDTIVAHGGGDSFMEEFYLNVKPFTNQGYRFIFFEGPGQGQALHKYNLKMTYQWEKPVKAILDFFDLNRTTLIGISLGGYFALRAAAYEPRISRVVLWDVVYDFFECIYGRSSRLKYLVLKFLVDSNSEKWINRIIQKQIEAVPEMRWILDHSMFVHGTSSIFELLKKFRKYTAAPISHLVMQDVLVLAGKDDHIIPFRMYRKQLKALKNAHSVSGRVFTKKEHSSSHCQVGNLNLVLNVISQWLKEKRS